MNPKVKKILRKVIYGVLFLTMIIIFIVLSEKYADNSKVKVMTITDYYEGIDSKKFEVLKGYQFVSHIKKDKNIVFIGSNTSEYSKKYIEILEGVIDEIEAIDSIYYYNITSDKSQRNSAYYEIIELLDGSLVTTDGTDNNLLAPSFYIIDKGEVLYYNIDTVAMKNTDKVSDFWTEERERKFKDEIIGAINKYYLN